MASMRPVVGNAAGMLPPLHGPTHHRHGGIDGSGHQARCYLCREGDDSLRHLSGCRIVRRLDAQYGLRIPAHAVRESFLGAAALASDDDLIKLAVTTFAVYQVANHYRGHRIRVNDPLGELMEHVRLGSDGPRPAHRVYVQWLSSLGSRRGQPAGSQRGRRELQTSEG